MAEKSPFHLKSWINAAPNTRFSPFFNFCAILSFTITAYRYIVPAYFDLKVSKSHLGLCEEDSWICGAPMKAEKLILFSGLVLAMRLNGILHAWRFRCDRRLDGKTALITEGDSDLAVETAKELARRGAKIVLAVKDSKKGQEALDKVQKASGNSNVSLAKLDLSSLKSVRSFAESFLTKERRLDILFLNPNYGAIFKKEMTDEGFSKTMAEHHFGPFLLTHLLIGLMKKSTPSRIVMTTSDLYRYTPNPDLDNLDPNKIPFKLYYSAKVLNLMFIRELGERLEGTGVTANAVHPGVVDTNIWKISNSVDVIARHCLKNAEECAQTVLYCAISDEPNVENANGRYFMDCREKQMKTEVLDEDKNEKLWEQTAKMVKLTKKDPVIKRIVPRED